MPSYRERFGQFAPRFRAESHYLHMAAPSVVRPGEAFDLRAVMMDAAGMPDEGFSGRVPLRASGPGLRVPGALEFRPDGFGMAAAEGLVAEQEGAFYAIAEPEGCPGAPPRTNPILARSDGPRLYWGDVHVHTVLGNCHPDLCKSVEFGYWYAREVALLDCCAATDHLRGLHRDPAHWRETAQEARRHNRPGEFVTFLGFESSHHSEFGGDINVYYNADEAEHFWVDRDDMRGISPRVGLDRLWDWLDEQGVPYLTLPHHTGRAVKYRDFELPFYNARREPVLEIYSWWGSSEARHDDLYLKGGKTDRRAYWRDALELGYRYGVIGSSDTHHTMPGTPYPVTAENYGFGQHRFNCQGLAAFWADGLERGQLFEALCRRRCYATTFWRPVVELSVSGVTMGQVAQADESMMKSRRIEAVVASDERGSAVLYRNHQPIARASLDETLTRIEAVDDEPLERLCIRDAPKSPEPFVFYHLKLHPRSGQVAWSSPVWLTL